MLPHIMIARPYINRHSFKTRHRNNSKAHLGIYAIQDISAAAVIKMFQPVKNVAVMRNEINFTELAAFDCGPKRDNKMRLGMSAAKMGLVGMCRALASEFAPNNIRVNVVSPGSIDTRRDNPEWYQGRPPGTAGIPLGRQGKVAEIAATCLFLVSDDGGFITGQTIHVNGGAAYY